MAETYPKVKENAVIEWKVAATHREPTWPLAGYAPGGYMGKCVRCQGHFLDMDKRAIHCLPCAVDAVKESLEQYRLETRRIEEENKTLRAAIAIVQPPVASQDSPA
ncbi:hypothetical protein EN858_15105 [Mesorhizobium sp. M4B.F.Ca.ET.215.01.1.1]|uniref:hypothetical protein n=1 Tax=unclassified Mesorhizobium TaxID=325217 RepID=UPI001093C6E0|nr:MULTISPECIES: hypothetical protein [unclassified Mesorhizobium]TGQ11247.1 hypothetical protein EN858_15105 [Mesorhizobium sp. M4B.F.Ca.ET.215.01.1.1]TGR04700.1 hypothetical protein EN846_12975 [Mesorhizobium sp. M4B.F.Ca.ET.203.01.1.1]